MIFPCPNKLVCPPQGNLDYDFPLQNLTSERPDHELFIGIAWGPLDSGGSQPPIGSVWSARGCAFVCQSTISQEDADNCARQQAALCTWGTWDPGHPPPGPGGAGGPPHGPQTIYSNNLAQCSAGCPDDSLFTWTILPGVYFALTQALADQIAQSVACQKAFAFFFCLGDLTSTAQTGQAYSSTAPITGNNPGPFTASIISGALPDGLFMLQGQRSVIVHGTPTKSGTFNFTIQLQDAGGNFFSKSFMITVKSSCIDLWTSLYPSETFQTTNPPSQAFRVGNTVTVSAYLRVAFDASAQAIYNINLPWTVVSNITAPIQCQLTLVPIALVNAPALAALQLVVQDASSAAVYLGPFSFVPVTTQVFNFTIPAGAQPQLGLSATVLTYGGNVSDAQMAYQMTLG
jgi:hypothetical protein